MNRLSKIWCGFVGHRWKQTRWQAWRQQGKPWGVCQRCGLKLADAK